MALVSIIPVGYCLPRRHSLGSFDFNCQITSCDNTGIPITHLTQHLQVRTLDSLFMHGFSRARCTQLREVQSIIKYRWEGGSSLASSRKEGSCRNTKEYCNHNQCKIHHLPSTQGEGAWLATVNRLPSLPSGIMTLLEANVLDPDVMHPILHPPSTFLAQSLPRLFVMSIAEAV